MILMSKYEGQHGGKKGSKNSGKALPTPPFRTMPERNRFFLWEVFPYSEVIASICPPFLTQSASAAEADVGDKTNS